MDGIKLIVSFFLIWFVGLASMGAIFKVMYHVFMLGWNLL